MGLRRSGGFSPLASPTSIRRMSTKISTLLSVVSLTGVLAMGACDNAAKNAGEDKKAETKDGAQVTVEGKDGSVAVEGKDGDAKVVGPDGSSVTVDGNEVTAKANGNEATVKTGDGTSEVAAKAADGTEATVKTDANGSVVEGGGGVVKTDASGTSVEKGGDSVKTDADGNTKIKSDGHEVEVGKDGKIKISGVPGL